MFWNGTEWVAGNPSKPAPAPTRRRTRDILATIPVLLLIPALLLPFLSVGASALVPTLTISGAAVPGGALTVGGDGFEAKTWVDLRWDGAPTGSTVRVDSGRQFSTQIVVPAAAASGTHWISVVGTSKGNGQRALLSGGGGGVLATVDVQVESGDPAPTATPAPTPMPTATPSPTPAPTPAPTPTPVSGATISAVSVSNVTSNGATIRWTVSSVATGQVEYGRTTSYGSLSTPELTYIYSTHVQTLSGLSAGATYHFRLRSVTLLGISVVSGDYVFATLPATSPTPTPSPTPVTSPSPTPTPSSGGTYPSTTTLQAIALPAVPSLPAKGVPISDPNGTKIRRIGDNGQRHAYSKIQPWNADGSLLFFAYGGKVLDGSTYAVLSGAMGNPGNFNWDPTDPRYGYSTQNGETNVYRHDVSNPTSPTRTALHNFGRAISLGRGEGAIADDGTVAVIDDSGNVATWNVKTNTGSAFWSTGGNPDSVTMSRDGNIVVAVFEPASTGHVNEIWAYNVDGSNAHRVRSGAQHGDTAIATNGRQVWIQADGQMHDLLTGSAAQLFSSSNAFASGHVSGRGQAGWGYYSVYNTSAQAGKPGNDQVVAVRLDGSAAVRVFGFASRRGASYETQPQAVPSRDGTRVLFASDWGNAGTYSFVGGMNP